MSTTPPTPSAGPPSPEGPSLGGKPDARAFFRDYYSGLADVPVRPYELDIPPFEAKYGTTHGYTREELTGIIRHMRKEVRKGKAGTAPAKGAPLVPSLGTLERWIMRIGFGLYVLAAIAILYFAASFQQLGWSFAALQPYVTAILATGGVLLVLSFGWLVIKSVELSNSIKAGFAVCILVLFVITVAFIVGWFAVLLFQQAPGIEKPRTEAGPDKGTDKNGGERQSPPSTQPYLRIIAIEGFPPSRIRVIATVNTDTYTYPTDKLWTGRLISPADYLVQRNEVYAVKFKVIAARDPLPQVEFISTATDRIRADKLPYSGEYKVHQASEEASGAAPPEGRIKYKLYAE